MPEFLDLIQQLGPNLPILGVCLGHQSIGQVFGGQIVSAPDLMHGKISHVSHTGYSGLENPITATRYHSLVIERQSCPDVLEITAWVEDGTMVCDIGTILTLRASSFTRECADDFRKAFIAKFPGTTAAVRGLMEK